MRMGWEGRWGKEPSYPTRPLPISELPPRHRAVALPSQPRPASTQMDVGKKVPGRSRRARCAGKVQARTAASFCKRHGGCVVHNAGRGRG